MIAIIERNPDIYIDEVADQLYTLHNVDVSLPTVYRAMKEVGFVHKKVDLFIHLNSQPSRTDY
jgi:Fe2+ or Zn2+ uptake regulation protein